MINIIFAQVALLMFFSVAIGYLAIHIRQPLILSFIIVGILAGPSCFGLISSFNEIEILASFGVTLLLFIVGLKMDIDLIQRFGKSAILLGIGQITITIVSGFLLALALGLSPGVALFVAVALTFSSTIIIIKLLSDRFEIDSLYGRMSIGILLVQDLVVIIAIIVLSSLNIQDANAHGFLDDVVTLVLKGVGFLAVIGLLMRYAIPFLLERLAKSRELLVLFAFTWAIVFAVVSEALGFGKEVGGFLAGVSLASSHYREAMASRLESVRNLLLLFFFLNLGATFHFNAVGQYFIAAIVLSLFVLFIKPLIVLIMMRLMNFRMRTGFLAGNTMGQLSEFSLIMAALGVSLGYIDNHVQALITLVALITIAMSTYMMAYAGTLYDFFHPLLSRFENKDCCREDNLSGKEHPVYDIIIYGFGRHGESIAKILQTFDYNILAIDFDPGRVTTSRHGKITVRYGDAEDAEFLKTLPLSHAKWVVSTIRHRDASQTLATALRDLNFQGKVALTAYFEGEIESLKKSGADMVLLPFRDAAVAAAERIAASLPRS